MVHSSLNEIQGYACHGKDQDLAPFTYTPAALQTNDVTIEITHCGICGSDLHTLSSGWGQANYPVIPGHEIVGHIIELGSDVTQFQLGDRVGVGAQAACCMSSECFGCGRGQEAHCFDKAFTYDSVRPIDGSKTYGGYAKAIRVQSDLVFKIPESIPSEYAAPLLCAGATVFTPMLQHSFVKGDKVGVIGIGGLGHLAIQFASALGCEVYAISHSESKRADAIQMGASQFINYSSEEESKAIQNKLKYLIVTSNAKDSQWGMFASWMDLRGKMILCALPEAPLSISPFIMITKNLSITGSAIGSIEEINKMLQVAAEHKVYPWIETLKMDQCNEGIRKVNDGEARYRIVLEN